MDEVKMIAKGAVYLAALVLALLLFLGSSHLLSSCVLIDIELWMRCVLGVLGIGLLFLNVVLVLILNKFIPVRLVFVKLGPLLFWVSWSMPLLTLVVAAACVTARLLGYEIELEELDSSRHRWDWD